MTALPIHPKESAGTAAMSHAPDPGYDAIIPDIIRETGNVTVEVKMRRRVLPFGGERDQ